MNRTERTRVERTGGTLRDQSPQSTTIDNFPAPPLEASKIPQLQTATHATENSLPPRPGRSHSSSWSSREQELALRGGFEFETGWCRDRDSNPDGETPTVFETAASACSAIPARPPTIARQSQFQVKVASGLSNAVPIFRLHVTTPRRNQRGQPRELV